MSETRNQVLKAIRRAHQTALLPGAQINHPVNDLPGAGGGMEQFVTEVELLSGEVVRIERAEQAAPMVADLCRARGWNDVLAWAWQEIGCEGLAEALGQAGITAWHDGAIDDLAGLPAGITGAEAGLADTGTLVVQNGPGRSPLASLLPPVHIALLDARRIYPGMREYLHSLPDPAGHIRAQSSLVFISGPSRTADIEQTLTLGVHGPRELIVFVYG